MTRERAAGEGMGMPRSHLEEGGRGGYGDA